MLLASMTSWSCCGEMLGSAQGLGAVVVGFCDLFSAGTGLLVVYAVSALGLARTDGRIGLLYTAAAAGL